jgi:hypothetical protein
MRDIFHMPDSIIMWMTIGFMFLCFLGVINLFPHMKYKNTSDEYEKNLLKGNFRLTAICVAGIVAWSAIDVIFWLFGIVIPEPQNVIIGLFSPALVYCVMLLRAYYKKREKARRRENET